MESEDDDGDGRPASAVAAQRSSKRLASMRVEENAAVAQRGIEDRK